MFDWTSCAVDLVKLLLRLLATGMFASSAGLFAWVVTRDTEPVMGSASASASVPARAEVAVETHESPVLAAAVLAPHAPTGEVAPAPSAPLVAPAPVVVPASARVVAESAGDTDTIDPTPLPASIDDTWTPPHWLGLTDEVLSLPMMEATGPRTHGPDVHARSVFIYDADADQVLFERRADEVHPVASITKLVSALTLTSLGGDLDREVCIGAEQYPTRNGARSHLSTHDCLTGWDIVGAALVASDNRAAMAMAAVADTDVDRFVEQMNVVSAELGMHSSSWSDPSGLEDENLSTARDIAKATLAVSTQPVLSIVATAPFWDIHRSTGEVRRLNSTDHLVGREDLEILTAKTGFTDTARYCFTTVVRTKTGRRVVVTLLGEEGKETRWGDMARILEWVDRDAG